MMADINLLHVPYRRDAPALTDLIGGQIQLCFVGVPAVTEYSGLARVEGPRHKVTIAKPFAVSKFDVTSAE
jgi:formylglycine-generating enzyme required for sulfatase activity